MRKAFTLIELLIVISILAVISAGMMVLIDPVEKINQANDSKIQSDIGQLAVALQSYSTQTSTGDFPCDVAAGAGCPNPASQGAGITALVNSGELKSNPTTPGGAAYTYTSAAPGTNAVVSTPLISKKFKTKCANTAYWFWGSANTKACGFCGGAAPAYNSTCATW